MRRRSRWAMLAVVLLVWGCKPATEQAPAGQEGGDKPLTTLADKASYVAGQDIGRSLKARGADIDLTLVLQGIEDSYMGREPRLKPEEVAEVKKAYSAKMREAHEKMRKELAEKNKADGEAFLAENAKKQGVVTTESGLQYTVLTEGKGPKPKETDQVRVHYVGTLIDGTEFDSSYKRGQPVTMRLDRVIPGWTEGLQLMPVGSKYRFVIPPKLAYGERGAGARIGPNAVLVFEVELLEIVEAPKAGTDTASGS